jgi:hypothetical protein
MTTTLNIGLNVGGKPTWDLFDVELAIEACLPLENTILRVGVYDSDTEQTAVVELSNPITPYEGSAIAFTLSQDCIAQLADGVGTLYGPKAAEWGPFNPEYFILGNGERAA